MKILVIDDSVNHQQSARQVLGGDHDLTVVGSHDEALAALSTYGNRYHAEEVKRKLREQGLPMTYDIARERIDYRSDPEQWEAWCDARTKAEKESYWDVVLSDLLMPAGKNAQGEKGLRFVGTEMPVGWSLAINAALSGAKFVAVVTDMSHHDHPASAMLDGMGSMVFTLHNARALFTNNIGRMVGIAGTERVCAECNGSGKRERGDGSTYECYICHATGTDYAVRGKDWEAVLGRLMRADIAES